MKFCNFQKKNESVLRYIRIQINLWLLSMWGNWPIHVHDMLSNIYQEIKICNFIITMCEVDSCILLLEFDSRISRNYIIKKIMSL